jgi:glutathione S-transferase
MLELYHAHISTCSQKVRLCLAEKCLEWTSHPMELRRGEQLTPAYLALNPNGVVPTLVHDGGVVIDSSVICEYLEEIAPAQGTRLMPHDPIGRATVRAWLRYIEEVPTVAIRIPSFNQLFLAGWSQLPQQARDTFIVRTPLRKGHYRNFGTEGFAKAAVDESMERLRQTVERIDVAVAKGSPWLAGEAISISDFCVLPTVVRMSDLHLEDVWAGLQHFQSWYDRIKTRPSFGAAFYPQARVAPVGSHN